MKIANVNLRKAGATILSAGMVVASLTACNRQAVDLNKCFNVAIETRNETVSVVGVKEYADYNGTSVQIRTWDGLVVLTSTTKTQLGNFKQEDKLDKYVDAIAGSSKEVMSYDDEQGTSLNYSGVFNKVIIDLNLKFNKAIILSDGMATIVNISSWRDFPEDDKVQLRLNDEEKTPILTDIANVKFVNDENAKEDSLVNYAASLVGGVENVTFFDAGGKVM